MVVHFMTNNSEGDGLLEAVGTVALGILGGIALATVIEALFRNDRCPVCNASVQRNSNQCPNCGTPLEWN